jgi:F-type H+-transporting ATPase subunit delta
MALTKSGKRYAQALFELASEGNIVESWAIQLEYVAEVLNNVDFLAFLNHAEVPDIQKQKAIGEVFKETDQSIQNLVSLLVKNSSMECVTDLVKNYADLLDQYLGKQRITVTTAVQLKDSQISNIKNVIAKIVDKEVVLDANVDDSIVGGIIIKIGDQLLDGSTKTQFNDMRRIIKSGNI